MHPRVTVWNHEALPRVTIWHHKAMPSDASDPEGRILLSALSNHDRFFFFHTFRSPAFDFNIGVAMNKSYCITLMSAILKVDVCEVTMTSTSTS